MRSFQLTNTEKKNKQPFLLHKLGDPRLLSAILINLISLLETEWPSGLFVLHTLYISKKFKIFKPNSQSSINVKISFIQFRK